MTARNTKIPSVPIAAIDRICNRRERRNGRLLPLVCSLNRVVWSGVGNLFFFFYFGCKKPDSWSIQLSWANVCVPSNTYRRIYARLYVEFIASDNTTHLIRTS